MVGGNLVDSDGWKIVNNRVFKTVPDYKEPSLYQTGQDNGSPAFSDTGMDKRVPIASTSVDVVDDCSTADWTESADATADATDAVNYKVGGGQVDNTSLKLGKSGTASATFTYNKTTTSTDVSAADALFVWVRFADAATIAKLIDTDAVTIRFGSDSSNYYQWTFDGSDMSAGWNLLKGSIVSPESTTGAPVEASMDYLYIAFVTDNSSDTITSGDINMDLWHVASEADYLASLSTGYPAFDYNIQEVSTRTVINAPEAVGYAVNAFSLWNADSTKLMFSLMVLDSPDTKSATEEFIVLDKYRRGV